MMAHQKPVELVEVEHKHDPVLCPKCGEKALKTACPVKPMPDPPKHGENMSVYLGLAYCEEHQTPITWCYRAAS